MNEMGRENNEIERLLQRAKLPEPSPELRERVTGAARKAWGQTATDISWQVPVRRLAISTAAALLMISLADYYGDHMLVARQSHGFAATIEEMPEPDDWLQVPSNLLVRHLSNEPSASTPTALLEYMEKIRRALDESEPTEAPDAVAPVEHRSRLLPARLNCYS
jgi:hypothetical protein